MRTARTHQAFSTASLREHRMTFMTEVPRNEENAKQNVEQGEKMNANDAQGWAKARMDQVGKLLTSVSGRVEQRVKMGANPDFWRNLMTLNNLRAVIWEPFTTTPEQRRKDAEMGQKRMKNLVNIGKTEVDRVRTEGVMKTGQRYFDYSQLPVKTAVDFAAQNSIATPYAKAAADYLQVQGKAGMDAIIKGLGDAHDAVAGTVENSLNNSPRAQEVITQFTAFQQIAADVRDGRPLTPSQVKLVVDAVNTVRTAPGEFSDGVVKSITELGQIVGKSGKQLYETGLKTTYEYGDTFQTEGKAAADLIYPYVEGAMKTAESYGKTGLEYAQKQGKVNADFLQTQGKTTLDFLQAQGKATADLLQNGSVGDYLQAQGKIGMDYAQGQLKGGVDYAQAQGKLGVDAVIKVLGDAHDAVAGTVENSLNNSPRAQVILGQLPALQKMAVQLRDGLALTPQEQKQIADAVNAVRLAGGEMSGSVVKSVVELGELASKSGKQLYESGSKTLQSQGKASLDFLQSQGKAGLEFAQTQGKTGLDFLQAQGKATADLLQNGAVGDYIQAQGKIGMDYAQGQLKGGVEYAQAQAKIGLNYVEDQAGRAVGVANRAAGVANRGWRAARNFFGV